MNELLGTSIIGFKRGRNDGHPLSGFNPATGETLSPTYFSASALETDRAVRLADQAFEVYGRSAGCDRAAFLRRIAENIAALGDELTSRAVAETGLPTGRIQAETTRTCNQLRMFADLVEEGSWVDARIDFGDPNRKPLPRSDVRSMLMPLGPTVVFGAGNFPLAFSTAGGDTASALAAGNPVVVKAHPGHPGTCELVGLAAAEAVKSCGLPEGVFSVLFDAGYEVGLKLVRHPKIKAVGFTGSRQGGLALMKAVESRTEPIPFFAEMSSINPVFILPDALRQRGSTIAAGLHASATLGTGQFCTNPGLVLLEKGAAAEEFIGKLAELMDATVPSAMLTPGIRSAFEAGVVARAGHAKVDSLSDLSKNSNLEGCRALPALFRTDSRTFLADSDLRHEIFGPSTLIVVCDEASRMVEIADAIEGQLTATVHATEEELRVSAGLVSRLAAKAGRVIFNEFPTGVEVCPAMVHGGPFPATSDGRSTSVGTRAITRFTRPVCFQGFPDSALPDELKSSNPLGISRLENGLNK